MVETWYSNGPDFKWDLKTGAKKSDFLPVKSKMVALSTSQPFTNRPSDISGFRRVGFQIFTVYDFDGCFVLLTFLGENTTKNND